MPKRDYGSSPRGRGTQTPTERKVTDGRFIPARAGNAGCLPGRTITRPVHPRAGGERNERGRGDFSVYGSSPRGRGTRDTEVNLLRGRRFIPARAGNASSLRARHDTTAVHPRAGGERERAQFVVDESNGSSPRGRGTLRRGIGRLRARRFIPARAGNARLGIASLLRMAVHPRAGGERISRTM